MDHSLHLIWSWSYGSWIYNYQCNQWLSPLMLWDRILFRRCILDTCLSVTCDRSVVFSGYFRFPLPIKPTATIKLKYCWNTRNHNLHPWWVKRHQHYQWLGTCKSIIMWSCSLQPCSKMHENDKQNVYW